MIDGNFTTFDNNRLKSTQFSHTPEVHPFSTLFHSTRAPQKPKKLRERHCIGWSTTVRHQQPQW